MALTNTEVAKLFSLTADLYDLEGSNPFRIRAYQNAARTIENLSEAVTARASQGDDLTSLPGIGKDIAKKIQQIAETGTFPALEELKQRNPAGLIDMLHIPNLGGRRVRLLHQKLGVTNLAELEKAAQDHKIQELEGFGKKMEEKICTEVQRYQSEEKRFLYAEAQDVIQPLLSYLQSLSQVETIDVAGSFRRKKETVGDIDILVISDEPEQVMDHFVAYDQTETVYGKGKTKSSIRLTSGIQIDLRVVPKENYGAALLYFTGSKAHNIALRRRAQERGWTINEYRVSDGEHTLASRTEEEIFQKLQLSYISPELREDRGEIEAAARDSLPGLIERDEMHGDLHCHTTWSDGSNSIEEMADAAEQLGYQYIGITDHSQRLTVAHGLTPDRLRKQIQEIDHFNEKAKIRILKGLEVDILEDGRLDMPDDVLRRLDYTVCSVHSKLDLPQEKQTKRMITAMQNPLCTIIGHPTGRIIGRRKEMDLDMKAVLREAAKTNTVMEINAQPDRLDLKDQYILYGREIGIRFVISTDAHSTRNMAYMQYGINIARRGWLSNNNVINTLPVQKIHSVLASKRG